MKATTHTELYRPYEETLNPRPPVERILAVSGIKQGFRKKLHALGFFGPSVIVALIGCVVVHLSFTMGGMIGDDGPGNAGIQQVLGNVSENIYRFLQVEQFFAFLTLAWYGSSLIADDRRLSANLLYFARPITPLRYILGKFGTAGAFGLFTLLAPALLICAQAAISSPDWVFLTDNYGVIVAVFGFCILWMLVMSSVILAISSCFKRRSLALVCSFIFLFLTSGISQVLAEGTDIANYNLLSLLHNLQAISEWLFHEPNFLTNIMQESVAVDSGGGTETIDNFLALGAMTLLSWIILYRNVKRMEVIA
ncbi:MAG: ABC-type transport system involved in multi-copper enzyme maturation permease subunit [Glaciecola sp.]|jgi:ABC-type transport system involved in multi-copper enzyme maturation permease subunit